MTTISLRLPARIRP